MSTSYTGIFKQLGRDKGVLRDPKRSLQRTTGDVLVPAEMITTQGLRDGARVTGTLNQQGHRYVLATLETICGHEPQVYQNRKPFSELTAIDPMLRFNFAHSDRPALRALDLVAPIGKGTRGLLVSPPKAGKTTLLETCAQAIHEQHPETRIIVLLIDERPEEVTAFRRAVNADVLASSNDQSVQEHVDLSELTLAHVRAELECGNDVIILVDSLTRMGRAFNLHGSGSGRTLSGGIDAKALEIPRRFFGVARNVEEGGSVTILATALIDTGSRMDQLIFEEFKGTGNSEWVLNRTLAEERIFPAVDVIASGTRREEHLYSKHELHVITKLRRALAALPPERATKALLDLVGQHPDNSQLLDSIETNSKSLFA